MTHAQIKKAIESSKKIMEICLENYELTGIEAYSKQAQTERGNLEDLTEMAEISYESQWRTHITELNAIAWNLDSTEDVNELTNIVKALKVLVVKASKNTVK